MAGAARLMDPAVAYSQTDPEARDFVPEVRCSARQPMQNHARSIRPEPISTSLFHRSPPVPDLGFKRMDPADRNEIGMPDETTGASPSDRANTYERRDSASDGGSWPSEPLSDVVNVSTGARRQHRDNGGVGFVRQRCDVGCESSLKQIA